MSSLSNSVDNSTAKDDIGELGESGTGWGENGLPRRSALYRYDRPGSRAFSLPIYAALGLYFVSTASFVCFDIMCYLSYNL